MSNRKHLQIRLELNKKIIHEITDFADSDSISIGHSPDCTWIIPVEDHVASSHHAVITIRNGKPCIRDTCSRNGIFYQGRKIIEKNLIPGDQISIGNCHLFVEIAKTGHKDVVHSVQFINGQNKGKVIALNLSRMTIGSAPGNDIPVFGELVSQRHAEINSRIDGCWIRDLASKNGTVVNGMRLSGDTERMLSDGDIVSISYIDLKFLDGNVEHSQGRFWYSLSVMVITVVVVLAGYYLYLNMNTPSSAYITKARAEAAKMNFSLARDLLQQSRSLRGAEYNEIRYRDLEQSITVWESIVNNWKKTTVELKNGKWVEASHLLGNIDSGRMDIWGWNDNTAISMRNEAKTSKLLLDSYLAGEAGLNEGSINPEQLETLRNMLANAIAASQGQAVPEYREGLFKRAKELLSEISKNLNDLTSVVDALSKLNADNVDYVAIIGELESIAARTQGGIRSRVELCILPISSLQRASKSLIRAASQIRAMNFEAGNKLTLELPPLEQCAINAHIANLRKNLLDQSSAVSICSRQLTSFVQDLAKRGLSKDNPEVEVFSVFTDSSIMDKVFACDVLNFKMPSRNRTQPSSEYDRVLGVDPFFEFLYALPEPFNPTIYSDLAFTPEIVKFHSLLRQMEAFSMFMNRQENKWLKNGELLNFHTRIVTLLTARNELTAKFLQRKGDARSRIIAYGIVIMIGSPDVISDQLKEDFVKEFKNLRQPIIKLNREYNNVPPEQAIDIRDSILRQGLPGDGIVRRMWSFKKY